jgi:hypothetical protein
MLLRLAYLGITNAFALLRLLPGSDRDKDTEILALRHQLALLQRQLDGQRVRFAPADRAWLAPLFAIFAIATRHHTRWQFFVDPIRRRQRSAECPPADAASHSAGSRRWRRCHRAGGARHDRRARPTGPATAGGVQPVTSLIVPSRDTSVARPGMTYPSSYRKLQRENK